MKIKNILVIVALLALAIPIAVFAGMAPEELQPTFVLMDGEEKQGLVWGLDYGWLIKFEGEDAIYTCGCSECDEIVQIIETIKPTDEPTKKPPDETPTPPTDTPEPPTDTPEPPKQNCNRGIGNGSENCDPGNSSGQGRGQGRRAGEDRDE